MSAIQLAPGDTERIALAVIQRNFAKTLLEAENLAEVARQVLEGSDDPVARASLVDDRQKVLLKRLDDLIGGCDPDSVVKRKKEFFAPRSPGEPPR